MPPAAGILNLHCAVRITRVRESEAPARRGALRAPAGGSARQRTISAPPALASWRTRAAAPTGGRLTRCRGVGATVPGGPSVRRGRPRPRRAAICGGWGAGRRTWVRRNFSACGAGVADATPGHRGRWPLRGASNVVPQFQRLRHWRRGRDAGPPGRWPLQGAYLTWVRLTRVRRARTAQGSRVGPLRSGCPRGSPAPRDSRGRGKYNYFLDQPASLVAVASSQTAPLL